MTIILKFSIIFLSIFINEVGIMVFKRGFTLAEVLITLGIIGVVAAITIPSLISKIGKRQLESQIKASYATIAQTMRSADAKRQLV